MLSRATLLQGMQSSTGPRFTFLAASDPFLLRPRRSSLVKVECTNCKQFRLIRKL